MTFGNALVELKMGFCVRRMGWCAGNYLKKSRWELKRRKFDAILFVNSFRDATLMWRAKNEDLLAEDWEIYESRTERSRIHEAQASPLSENLREGL